MNKIFAFCGIALTGIMGFCSPAVNSKTTETIPYKQHRDSLSKTKLPISPMADMTLIGKAASDSNYFTWCTSPIQERNGSIHLFVTRWPKTPEGMSLWYTHSEIVHYKAETPEGPYRFIGTVMPSHPDADWNNSMHNSAVFKAGKTYVLLYVTFDRISAPKSAKKMSVCMAVSKSINGPWKKIGERGTYEGRIIKPSTNPSHWTYTADRGFDNPTFLAYGGKFYIYFKTKSSRALETHYGYAVADKVEGPYVLGDRPATDNISYIEDATAFVWNKKINLLTCDNFGNHTGIYGAGILWQSDTPTQFRLADAQTGFLLPGDYWTYPIDPKKLGHPKKSFKFERPGVLLQKGQPAYFYGAPGDSPEGDNYTSSYVFKINLPQKRR